MTNRPRIGITTSLIDDKQQLDRRYVESVEHAGGLPVIVPMTTDESLMFDFAALLEGLIVTGGPAITDRLVGDLPSDIEETDPIRVRSDKAIVNAFIQSRKPVFGICYGMQLLNAMRGGSIYADVERQRPDSLVHSKERGGIDHAVHAEPGSRLARVIGATTLRVNTRHIQAVAELGDGLAASLKADDGCIEGIENADGLIMGVQFHPESMGREANALFRDLVSRAQGR